MFVLRFFKRFAIAVLVQLVGLAVAIILLVASGREAALLAIAVTLLIVVFLIFRAGRKGWSEGKQFVGAADDKPTFTVMSRTRPQKTGFPGEDDELGRRPRL